MTECVKKRYYTRKDAKKYLKSVNKKGRITKKLTNVYKCNFCDMWHTTSMEKKSSRNYTRSLNNKK